MLERLSSFHVRHRKSGREFSTLQKLNLYYQSQRRQLLGARALFENLASRNPGVKQHLFDALRAVGAAEDALLNEYTRDRKALLKHTETTE